jgi:DNA polymerase-3 subunit chi
VTQIDFYTHVADKVPVAVRLTGKAWDQGMKVWIRVPDETLARVVDEALWIGNPQGFIPHCLSSHPLALETPVIIDPLASEPRFHELLINLGSDRPEYFSRFERLIEIVSLDESDRMQARERFTFYRDRGFDIRTHNLSQQDN